MSNALETKTYKMKNLSKSGYSHGGNAFSVRLVITKIGNEEEAKVVDDPAHGTDTNQKGWKVLRELII